jgi:valyl-tRNA synthetase
MELDKTYEPQLFEPHWADWWVENNVFRADASAPGPDFSIVVPPPNVTGSMHIGHMLEHSLIDTAVRWHRMRGDNTLFLPGVDHAGIATQMLVERSLAAEATSRREHFTQPRTLSRRHRSVRSALRKWVATTRPETMLGDTAVAVNPKDERWFPTTCLAAGITSAAARIVLTQ